MDAIRYVCLTYQHEANKEWNFPQSDLPEYV